MPGLVSVICTTSSMKLHHPFTEMFGSSDEYYKSGTTVKAFTEDVVASYRLVRLQGLTSRDPVQRLRSEVVAEIKKSLAHIGRIEVLMDRSLEDISKKDFSILAMPKTDHTTADRCNVQRTRRLVNLPIPRKHLL